MCNCNSGGGDGDSSCCTNVGLEEVGMLAAINAVVVAVVVIVGDSIVVAITVLEALL